jgi:hypothetical protein
VTLFGGNQTLPIKVRMTVAAELNELYLPAIKR